MTDHLKTRGYGDIAVTELAVLPWYRVDINEPIVQAVLTSCHELGFLPQVWPNSAGACFVSVIGRLLGVPAVEGGLLSGGGSHGADEYMVVRTGSGRRAGLLECEKSYVSILCNFPHYASMS